MDLPIEFWKLVGDVGIESLETTMNDVMNRGMPSSCRYSEISPIYTGKGSVLEYGNYRGIRGRSQLSTFMKAYTAYAREEGVWDHRTLFPRKSTFIFNHCQCIIKYCTCLECGQYAHICRCFMYNNTFEALFLTSKCTKRGFLWTQTVAPHHGFCKAAYRRYRIFST